MTTSEPDTKKDILEKKMRINKNIKPDIIKITERCK